jgi:hypothetical protein
MNIDDIISEAENINLDLESMLLSYSTGGDIDIKTVDKKYKQLRKVLIQVRKEAIKVKK